MEGILLHVLYRGEKANDFASEMERSGLRAAVPAALDKHSAGEPLAKLKALKASYDLATTVERFE